MTVPALNRAWCGKCSYPGKAQFYLGTVVLTLDASAQQVDQALAELWVSLSPHPQPRTIAIRGTVFFAPESAPST